MTEERALLTMKACLAATVAAGLATTVATFLAGLHLWPAWPAIVACATTTSSIGGMILAQDSFCRSIDVVGRISFVRLYGLAMAAMPPILALALLVRA